MEYSSQDQDTLNEVGVADNIDPEGLSSLEEFDPSEEFRPMEVYECKTDNYHIKIIIPLETLDEEYIGVVIDGLTPEREIFDEMLEAV